MERSGYTIWLKEGRNSPLSAVASRRWEMVCGWGLPTPIFRCPELVSTGSTLVDQVSF